jgi:hypothetical protein
MSYFSLTSFSLKDEKSLENDEPRIMHRSSDGFVNATEICKIFKTDIAQWKRLKGTSAFLQQLSLSLGKNITDLITYETLDQEGSSRGTWVHMQIALEIIHWVMPTFQVKMTEKLHELIMNNEIEFSINDDRMMKLKVEMALLLKENETLKTNIITSHVEKKLITEENARLKNEISQITAQRDDEITRRMKIKKKYNALLKKREYQKYPKRSCFYVWKDPSPNYLRHKLGRTKNLNRRFEEERTSLPDFKLVMLVYIEEAKLLETMMLCHFKDKLLESNHEVVVGVSSEEIIVATQRFLNFSRWEYKIEPNISEYNLTPPNEQIHDDVKAMVTEMYEKKIEAEMNPKQSFSCTWPDCTKTYGKKCHLNRHVEQVHKKSSQAQCQECGDILSCAESLRNHMFTHEDKKPVCLHCKKDFSNPQSLNRHIIEIHSDNGQVACPQCGKLITRSNLKIHVRRMHEKSVKFPCEKCGVILSSKANLVYHTKNSCPKSSPESS